jgi:hypothetical protein
MALTTLGTQGYASGFCPSNHTGRLSLARITVPWNAVFSSSNTGTGSPSCVWGTGSGVQSAEQSIANAKADGLTPMLVLDWDPADGQNPKPPSDNGYYCGLLGLMVWMTNTSYTAWNGVSYNLHVSDWELLNEPDGHNDPFNTDPGNKFGHTSGLGPLAAGDLYADALFSRAAAGGADASDRLAVGAFGSGALSAYGSPPCCAFVANYLFEVAEWAYFFGLYPAAVTGHPYDDITTAGADGYEQTANLLSQTNSFSNTLAGTPIWLTEASAWLDAPGQSRWGVTTDGNPCAQYDAAQTFLNIGGYSSQIARIYWHEFEVPANAQVFFDGGLLAPPPSLGSGAARASY